MGCRIKSDREPLYLTEKEFDPTGHFSVWKIRCTQNTIPTVTVRS
jgi:hypothetical protein